MVLDAQDTAGSYIVSIVIADVAMGLHRRRAIRQSSRNGYTRCFFRSEANDIDGRNCVGEAELPGRQDRRL